MGTNYYIHRNECNHCGRSDPPIHIGKSSFGWSFSFRAYDAGEIDGVGYPITSRKDWVSVLRLNLGTVKDEYGNVVNPSVPWINEMDRPSEEQIMKEARETLIYESPSVVWRDAEGFRFRKGEFG